ncbi:SDR family NAD(P)-dependent oxidoreductase [Paracoccus laeviglucosivorans]|uniref:NAD(P)-dependent dehydrogenase, short-chain alcohol dehydrogenase family n=1 Tax=Paracoccus laeviglucosivorans TaxID=1197861 RepID=A0A521BCQ1_9RHOB|nr:SDR family oxidoreductase [Paracoccus laeviglucosivorans]SMO44751.1 NAD(P)-dependent dehydrogenase, short-chain alcohol dehydrogenase family [Paracoccus laeviglucosivorans]
MKIAVITGGSRGLGRNAALHLARAGVGVVLTYHGNSAAADQVVEQITDAGGKAAALQLDTADVGTFADFSGRLRDALQRGWGRADFDYLFNNAGHGIHKPFMETTPEDFDGLVAVHLKGVFFLTQQLLPLIVDGGRILNVSSGLARFSLPGYAAYATMKGGVEVLSRYLARELGHRGIAVNTLAPGAIETDFGGGAVRDIPEVNRMVAAATAMGRAGLPDDIGGAVASILTDGMGWMTGQRIEVSGGQNL